MRMNGSEVYIFSDSPSVLKEGEREGKVVPVLRHMGE
jgi:hypothetical protein